MTKKFLPSIIAILLLTALLVPQVYGEVSTGADSPGILPPEFGPPAEWVEDFDSYADGSQMHGQGDWKGWDNNPAGGALVTSAFSLSSPHSVEIVGATDLVHEFSGFTTGQWVLTAWNYVPSGTTNGPTYFIVLNTYADGGPNNWSTQVSFDDVAGVVLSDFDGETLALVTDTWVEIRLEIDLDANNQDFYYNGSLLHSKSWTEGVTGGGVLNIAALNLFANSASSIYYDDLSLCPASGCAPAVSVIEIPTLGTWAITILTLVLLMAGLVILRRRHARVN